MALRSIGSLPAEGGAGGYAIASIHRNENLSNKASFDLLMEEVIEAASRLPVKFVLHPATRAKIRTSGWLAELQRHPQLELMERMDYPDFVRLLVGSRFLLTDGGSNQEEAAMLGLPTLLLRRATERLDGLGSNVELSGLDRTAIRSFSARHSQTRWPLRLIEDVSPSAVLVDSLALSGGTGLR
jgi:UDP-N-acetylglucosamine 2-epimerase (non-hydrolysing)